MEKLQKIESSLKWVALVLAVACILVCFAPAYAQVYSDSIKPDVEYYFYSNNTYILSINTLTIAILILSLVFLFSSLKSNKVFFIGMSFIYFLNSIFSIVAIEKTVDSMNINNSSSTYIYKYMSGYYLFITFLSLFMAIVLAYFILSIIQSALKVQQVNRNDNVKSLKAKIETLTYLKEQGILSDDEFDAKRTEIVENLKF